MRTKRMFLTLAVTALLGAGSLQAVSADLKAARPHVGPGSLTSLPGAGTQASTHCCSATQCTQVNLLTVCKGPKMIRWTCSNGECEKEPFGGDN